MDWWIVLGLVMIGVAIGLLAAFVWFAWSFRDFMS